MLETWVLVMWLGGYYGKAIATVPGYATEAECLAAAKLVELHTHCIPGPKISRMK